MPARGQSKKKNTTQGVFFFCSGPGERQGKEKPRWAPRTLGGVFFCSGPVPAPNGASPSLAFRRGRSKKKTPWVVFFFFFCSGPVPARGFSFYCLSPGPEQKKHPGCCFFFFCSGPAERSRRPRSATKKNTLHTRGRQQKIF